MSSKWSRMGMLVAAFLSWSAGTVANDYTVYRVSAAPAVDGRTDEPGWQKIPWAYGFRNLYEQYTYSPKQTAFKIGYDSSFLYVALRCCEPEMAKIKAGERAVDGWPTTLDDVYFIYSNSYAAEGTWEDSPFTILQLGAGGIRRALRARGEVAAPAEWKIAYRADDRNWFIETAVPLELLEADPDRGGFFNVVRHLQTVTGGRLQKTSSWNVVTNSKLDQHTFSALRFSPDNGATNVAREEAELLSNFASYSWWLGGILRKIADGGGEYAEARTRLANAPDWPLAERARKLVQNVMKGSPRDLGATTDAYLSWQYALLRMTDTSPPIRLALRTRHATARVFVNGREATPKADGACELALGDGINVVAVAAAADGPDPGVELTFPEFPETDGRWTVSASAPDAWQEPNFDDREWQRPATQGVWVWSGADAGRACFRQVLLWSRNVYGGTLACMVPPHTQYGFSPGTTEVLQHAIFPPDGRRMRSYGLQLEVPAGFRLLDTRCPVSRPYCWNPSDVFRCEIEVDGHPYLQYTLTYDVSKVESAYSALLPLKLEGYESPEAKAAFRFRRLINDNVTELTSVLPVHILPPVNGRCMDTFYYVQYDHKAHRSLSTEVAAELVTQGVAAGMDRWIVSAPIKNGSSVLEQGMLSLRQIVRSHGGRVVGSFPEGMPLWGAFKDTELYELIRRDPAYGAAYFNNTGNRFTGETPYSLDFCFTHALGDGRKVFTDALLRDYRRWKQALPEADLVFFNNENYPWTHTGDVTDHRYCFCDRCKTAFRQSAGLPPELTLSDQDIWETHRDAWSRFWKQNQSGRLVALTRETANAAGFRTIHYHNTGDRDGWRAASGKADLYCVGFPGGSAFVNHDSQPGLDDTMQFFQSIGIPRFIGQRRTYFPFRDGRAARYRSVSSRDGWALNPKNLKTEIVRMAATTHGGVVYESVMQLSGGALYYFGEATRLVAAFEELFHRGQREDALADAGDVKYPDILVLTNGDERLVLVFNETAEAKELKLVNHKLKPGQRACVFERPAEVGDPASMDISVPPGDVIAVHISKPAP